MKKIEQKTLYLFIRKEFFRSSLYEIKMEAQYFWYVLSSSSMKIIIDTESWSAFRQPNKSALIQVQLILPGDSSFVLLAEVNHLPKEDNIVFKLIQQLW